MSEQRTRHFDQRLGNPRKQHNSLLWQSSTSSTLHVYTPHWPSQRHHSSSLSLPLRLPLQSSRSLCSLRAGKSRRPTPYPIDAPNPNSSVKFALDRTVAPSGAPTASRRRPHPQSSPPASSSSASAPTPTRIIYRESRTKSDFPFWQQTWFIVLLFVMAIGFFGLALFLFLGLDFDQGSPSPAYAASSDGVEITYGAVLKLMHEKTKFRLHSHDVPYGSGSGQQSVTGFSGVDDSNSYWIVRPQPGTSAKQGDPIKSGTIIRLQHMKTRKWLHSHLHASPITGNLEVSCFGGETESDTGDYWRLMVEGSGKTWKQEQRIRLQHVDTGGYLHSHDKKYQRIAGGQQEVCGVREKKADNIWLAAEGVYLPVTESK